MVEKLPSKFEALSSNPNTAKNKNNKMVRTYALTEHVPDIPHSWLICLPGVCLRLCDWCHTDEENLAPALEASVQKKEDMSLAELWGGGSLPSYTQVPPWSN
jgi:hypothetical protein